MYTGTGGELNLWFTRFNFSHSKRAKMLRFQGI